MIHISSGVLRIWIPNTRHKGELNPERITVGRSSDLAVELLCFHTANNNSHQWSYGDNDTVVLEGPRAFGTSQRDGWLRIYPSNILSPNGTMFKCKHESGETLEVTFVSRKCLQFYRDDFFLFHAVREL